MIFNLIGHLYFSNGVNCVLKPHFSNTLNFSNSIYHILVSHSSFYLSILLLIFSYIVRCPTIHHMISFIFLFARYISISFSLIRFTVFSTIFHYQNHVLLPMCIPNTYGDNDICTIPFLDLSVPFPTHTSWLVSWIGHKQLLPWMTISCI